MWLWLWELYVMCLWLSDAVDVHLIMVVITWSNGMCNWCTWCSNECGCGYMLLCKWLWLPDVLQYMLLCLPDAVVVITWCAGCGCDTRCSGCGCDYMMQWKWLWLHDAVDVVVIIWCSGCGCDYMMRWMWLWLHDAVDVVVITWCSGCGCDYMMRWMWLWLHDAVDVVVITWCSG